MGPPLPGASISKPDMLHILSNRTYRHLFAAQVIALIGTGLATVALGLLAFDLAGDNAGMVLGTALAIKMIAYVGVAPVAAAFAERWPRRTMLVTLDLVRAGVALMLPFVFQIWQVYVLIFVLQAASAAFTPTFQATIPDVLPNEKDYTKALSLSRLAYDMESLVSPMLAAALLTVIGFHDLFAGTVVGFLASAALVVFVVLPTSPATQRRGIYDRTTRGLRIYLATPRLRGLLAVNAAVAAAGSMVFVNTVVMVQAGFGLNQSAADRRVMLGGSGLMVAGMFAGTLVVGHSSLLALWFVLGLGYSTAQTPSGRLLRRSSNPEDRPALFAAQFALSHACWLLFYPLTGWLGVTFGMSVTFVVLGVSGALAVWATLTVWPAIDPEVIEHEHPELPAGHDHTRGAVANRGGVRHAHRFVVDDHHPHWPNMVR